MTTNRSLSPSPAAALHLLSALGIVGTNHGLPNDGAAWDSLKFLRPGAEQRLVDLARALGTADGTLVPIGRILNEVTREQAFALIEAVGIAVAMPQWAGEITTCARLGPSARLPRWVHDEWTPVQAACALIARRAFADPVTYRGDDGRAYDWRYAMRHERYVDAAIVGEAIESDLPCIDLGRILRTNAGWFNATYLMAFAVAAGITTDDFTDSNVHWELTQAAAHDGLTPHVHEPLVWAC